MVFESTEDRKRATHKASQEAKGEMFRTFLGFF
jgi:hypothetical protein